MDVSLKIQIDAAVVVKKLDHYAPKLEQLMRERNLLTDKGGMVKWKDVSPLLPLSKKRKTLPLAKRDTGHSVDECKRKAQERKHRRIEEEKVGQVSEKVKSKSSGPASGYEAAATLP